MRVAANTQHAADLESLRDAVKFLAEPKEILPRARGDQEQTTQHE